MDTIGGRSFSFLNCKALSSNPSMVIALADNGFYYDSQKRVIACYMCQQVLPLVKPSEMPSEPFSFHTPHCVYKLSQSSSNCQTDTKGFLRGIAGTNAVPPVMYLSPNRSDIEEDHGPSDSKRHSRPDEGRLTEPDTRTNLLIMKENETMRKSLICKMCLEKTRETLFLPCAHLITCDACADKITNCIQCKKHILGTVRVYLL